jgi:DNA end-binding protein Ku
MVAAARAMWKGVLELGKERVPVKLHAAVQDRGIHFHLLHARDLVRVQQHMVDPRSGKVVEPDRIRMGYESAEEPGVFVLLGDEERKRLAPVPSRTIEICRFVPRAAVGRARFLRPYHLTPDGTSVAYAALAVVLERKDELGIVRWVMRNTEYAGALHAIGGRLMLITLRPATEVIEATELEAPGGAALPARERKLARQLVEMLSAEFDPAAYHDQYRERVLELLAAKARGEKPVVKRFKRKAEPASLASALEQSLRAARPRAAGERASA